MYGAVAKLRLRHFLHPTKLINLKYIHYYYVKAIYMKNTSTKKASYLE